MLGVVRRRTRVDPHAADRVFDAGRRLRRTLIVGTAMIAMRMSGMRIGHGASLQHFFGRPACPGLSRLDAARRVRCRLRCTPSGARALEMVRSGTSID